MTEVSNMVMKEDPCLSHNFSLMSCDVPKNSRDPSGELGNTSPTNLDDPSHPIDPPEEFTKAAKKRAWLNEVSMFEDLSTNVNELMDACKNKDMYKDIRIPTLEVENEYDFKNFKAITTAFVKALDWLIELNSKDKTALEGMRGIKVGIKNASKVIKKLVTQESSTIKFSKDEVEDLYCKSNIQSSEKNQFITYAILHQISTDFNIFMTRSEHYRDNTSTHSR